MRRKLPPLNALLAFEAAARHCSFTAAANELSIAQPAVTRHIANIENWIGMPLFLRRGSKIELTQEGLALSDLATATFDRLELGVQRVLPANKDEFVIGASFGVAHLWVMPRISGMRAASGKNINLVTSDDYRMFDEPGVDFSIRFGDGQFGDNTADHLFDEKCHIIAAPSFLKQNPDFNPSDPLRSIDPMKLLDHGDPKGIGWMDWERFLSLTGGSYPGRHALRQVQSYPTMLDMVCAGEGISIGTIGIEDDLIASGKLICVGLPISREGFGYYLVYSQRQRNNNAFQRLRESLVQEFR